MSAPAPVRAQATRHWFVMATISLAAGFGAGVIYLLLHVQSPVPPLIGLTGLFGIVFGEWATSRITARVTQRRARRQGV